MAIHRIDPVEGMLHGPFSRERQPVLTIAPGDTVQYRTLDAGWGLEPFGTDGKRKRFPNPEPGHALCGPIAIEGAQPGMVLAVHINRIEPGLWGWTAAGGFDHPVNRRLGLLEGPEYHLNWTLDTAAMVGTSQFGHQVGLRPFVGVMGMPPDEPGQHSTAPPRYCGGNIDCKELIAGTTLYLPIAVAGGLFSVGDGHAVQGDGEVSVTAIECPMDLVELTFDLVTDSPLHMPRAKTPDSWITFGFHEDLDEATFLALDGMLDLMEEQFGLSRKEALALSSLLVDMRVTQIVNGSKGVHAVLRHGALQRAR